MSDLSNLLELAKTLGDLLDKTGSAEGDSGSAGSSK